MNPYTRNRKKSARRKVRKMRVAEDTLRREIRSEARGAAKADTRAAMDAALLERRDDQ